MKLTTPEISWHGKEPVLSVDFCKIGSTMKFASAGADNDVKIWSVSYNQEGKAKVEFLANLSRHNKAVNVVRFSPNEELLASAGDDCVVILWRLSVNQEQCVQPLKDSDDDVENRESWTASKVLRGHIEDVYDLAWSPDGSQLISGSVDNSAIIWDIAKGVKLMILKDHKHYVQGVCWDPLGQYVVTNSSDRSCRLYNTQSYRCCYNINKLSGTANIKIPDGGELKQLKMFHDETMLSFFRRPAFTPDGSLLIVPAGKIEMSNQALNTTYVFTRGSPNKPVLYLPSPKKPTVAVRCCPLLFDLKTNNKENDKENEQDIAPPLFKIAYRMVFAVASLNSVLLYDTQHKVPFGYISNIHYSGISDVTWSNDGSVLVVCSTDGYCSLIHFHKGELGTPYKMTVKEVLEKPVTTNPPVNTSSAPLIETPDNSGKASKNILLTPVQKMEVDDEPTTPDSETMVKKRDTPLIDKFAVPVSQLPQINTPSKPVNKIMPRRVPMMATLQAAPKPGHGSSEDNKSEQNGETSYKDASQDDLSTALENDLSLNEFKEDAKGEEEQPANLEMIGDRVLIERDGKFELVDVSEIKAEYFEMLGISPAEKKEGVEHAPEEKSPTQNEEKPRPRTTFNETRRRNTRNSSPERRTTSARFSRSRSDEYSNIKSTYGMSEDQLKIKRRREEAIAKRKKEEKEREDEEMRRKREDAERAFQAWLSAKLDEARERRREEERNRPDPTLEQRKQEDAKSAYEEWLVTKRYQEKVTKEYETRRRSVEASQFVIRDRFLCDEAFKRWLRKKKADARAKALFRNKRKKSKPKLKKKEPLPLNSKNITVKNVCEAFILDSSVLIGSSSQQGTNQWQDSYWSCVVCFAAFLSCVVTQGLHGSFGLVYVSLLDNFGQSKAVTAWVGSAALAVACLFSPVVGLLCNRYGYRIVTIGGGVTCAIGLFLTAHAPNLPVVYVTYTIIFGFGASCTYTSAFIVVTDYFSKWRSLATGITCAGSSCGVLVMTPTISVLFNFQVLLRRYDWETTFTILSLIALVPCFCGCTYDPRIRKHLLSMSGELNGKPTIKSFPLVDLSVWKIPSYSIYALSLSVIVFGYYIPRAHLARYCEDLGISTDQSAWFYFYSGLASLFGRIIFGQLCNFRKVNAFYVTQITASIIGVATLLLPLARVPLDFIIYSLVIGFFDGGVNTPSALLVFECVGRERMAAGWSSFLFATGVTISIGPPLAGTPNHRWYMADSLQSYDASLFMSGVVIIFGSTLLFLLKCFPVVDKVPSPIELKILQPSDLNLHQRNLSNGTVKTNVSSFMVMVV
ncbi:hypothetical protein QZH41_014058 [Actinostola sp. cb2023]|nr:hypothetical protein QZH41_014058 [Actinostola sp. cb2023]